jgi:hypothetical protein
MQVKQSILKKVALLAGLAAVFTGCEEMPTDPTLRNADLTVSEAAAKSSGLFGTMNSVQQAGDMLRGPDAKIQIADANFSQNGGGAGLAKTVSQAVLSKLRADMYKNQNHTVLGDSLLWQITQINSIAGFTETSRAYYDFATGKARLEHVKYNFDGRHELDYDSTTVSADLNFTLDNDTDDMIERIATKRLFKAGAAVVSQTGVMEFDPYTRGGDPESGNATNTTVYAAGQELQQTVESFDFAPESGTWGKQVSFADGSSASESVQFNSDGTGSFNATMRDGTKKDGSFNIIEDDNQGSFTQTITFPAGSNPASIYENGQFRLEPADSTMHGEFVKEIRMADESILRETVKIDESYEGDVLVTTVEFSDANGKKGTFSMREENGVARVNGAVEEATGEYIVFNAVQYPDGTARIEYDIWESKAAHDSGAAPIVSAIINYYPDGSGAGKVTEGGASTNVRINPDGSVVAG